jgi:hypothetical protein
VEVKKEEYVVKNLLVEKVDFVVVRALTAVQELRQQKMLYMQQHYQ